ncbi:MAG: biotin/lipoyl-binding protein [Deltaproteobacteria bacterium]|jgi:acetyl-CoA carboxylase carboxyltransferase component|nr:biotin/lipoyl-binding protein [Deltaproteobacteria bacterium]
MDKFPSIRTNESFLLRLLNVPELLSKADWLNRLTSEYTQALDDRAGVALFIAGVEAYLSSALYARTSFFAAAARGRPQSTHESLVHVDCWLRGEKYRFAVQRISPNRYRHEIDGRVFVTSIDPISEFESRVTLGDRTFRVVSINRGGDHLIEVDNVIHRIRREDAGLVRAPSPSLVVSVNVKEGDFVSKGDMLVVLEAMKMETAITAPVAGTVVDVFTGPSIQVNAGSALIRIEPVAEREEATAGERIDFSMIAGDVTAPQTGRERCLEALDAIRWTILGYDTKGRVVRDLSQRLLDAHKDTDFHEPKVVTAGLEVLTAFSDICSLARNQRVGETEEDEAHNPKEDFHSYLRALDLEAEGLPETFRSKLERAFSHYGIDSLEPSEDLKRAAFRIFMGQLGAEAREPLLSAVLNGLQLDPEKLDHQLAERLRRGLDSFVVATELRFPNLGNLARNVRYRIFEQPIVAANKAAVLDEMRDHVAALRTSSADASHLEALINCPEAVIELLAEPYEACSQDDPMLEVFFRRFYRDKELLELHENPGLRSAGYHTDGEKRYVVATIGPPSQSPDTLQAALDHGRTLPSSQPLSIDVYIRWDGSIAANEIDSWARNLVNSVDAPQNVRRITFSGAFPAGKVFHHTYRRFQETFDEDLTLRHCHPMIAARAKFFRFRHFTSERLESAQGVYAYKLVGIDNSRDIRLAAVAEVRDLIPSLDNFGNIIGLPSIEKHLSACANAIRKAQTEIDPRRRLAMNRIVLYLWPPFSLPMTGLDKVFKRFAALSTTLGLEMVELIGTLRENGQTREAIMRFALDSLDPSAYKFAEFVNDPVPVLDQYRQNVIMSQQRGSIYPYELIDRLTRDGGSFQEYAVTKDGAFEPINRPKGKNDNGFVGGLLTTPSERYPEGITRVVLLGDPTKELASLAEPECRMTIGALELAKKHATSLEWYAVSAGARISMTSGTENMDWISIVLRKIIEFTQEGGEINIIITGITVGGQPYWNAEATMLMHTKGILIMTPDSSMVLTGKQSLDFSGGVSAEDNFGIGGYDRIMGPNGQAQYWAPNLEAACELMRRHNEHTYRAAGERFPRRSKTSDDPNRDVRLAPHDGPEFETIGEVFSDKTNPGRKKPFDIRSIMNAVADQDHNPLERWKDMRDAETGVVFEAQLGGYPVMMIGIASRAIPRKGLLPADGPEIWTSGTLFPMSSKKLARAINSASGNRPLVILANLSGFDGSPESLAKWQLEYGAEIGRAIVNFNGPIVFCVVSRYHGGAFVVFSKVLNDNMQALAVEGTYASVLGGAPAAAVVFTREVDKRTDADERIVSLRERLEAATGTERVALQTELAELRPIVRAEKLGQKAAEYDAVHTIERAQKMGSVDAIIPAEKLRPELISALEHGIERALSKSGTR